MMQIYQQLRDIHHVLPSRTSCNEVRKPCFCNGLNLNIQVARHYDQIWNLERESPNFGFGAHATPNFGAEPLHIVVNLSNSTQDQQGVRLEFEIKQRGQMWLRSL